MKSEPKTFYITTAIDYPNSIPHMGHAYEKVVADFYARCARLRGLDTWFLVGLDEHGHKIQEAARADGKSPREFVDEKAVVFEDLYRLLEISNTDFIRTSQPRHHAFVRELYERTRDAGDIYAGTYQADYCVGCERALTRSELVEGMCPIHNRPPTPVEEPSYFFRLSKYRDALREHIQRNPEFIVPAERRNEVLARLSEEVLDLSISRSTFDWGIPVPDDPAHVIYVWFDALSNYISALDRPQAIRGRYWPADCHVIGKDILWFHCVIWPAMLLSAGIELPRQIYAHGFILDKEGRKMSKHLGNVVDPLEVAREYSVDVLRYYFLRAFGSGQDGNFSLDELEERYHTELGNDLGNLVQRVSKLAVTRAGGEVAPPRAGGELDPSSLIRQYVDHAGRREHHKAIDALWTFVRATNQFITQREPWKLKDDSQVRAIIYTSLEALRAIAHLLEPAMPRTAARIAATLGFEIVRLDRLEPDSLVYRVRMDEPLFPRRQKKRAAAAEAGGAPAQAPVDSTPDSTPGSGPVDPFSKLELRVGIIEEVRPHPDADSLYAMTVDIGGEKRSICAGLRAHLDASELQGHKTLVLANLKPAMLRGIESRGMVLASDARDGRVVPVDPGDAPSGDLAAVEGIESRPKKKLSLSEFQKAPLVIQGGRVTYGGRPLRTSAGEVACDSEDGAPVR